MSFIPQALADPASRYVLHVFQHKEDFERYWADKVKTIDAPGVAIHPRLIRVGDVIDWYITGWNKSTVDIVTFYPDATDIPDWHRSGCFQFNCNGSFINVRADGRNVVDAPIYIFPPEKNNP